MKVVDAEHAMKQLQVGPDYIRNLVELVRSQGTSADSLFAAAGLDYDPADDGGIPLDAASYSRLYGEAIKLAGDECFGFLGPGRIPYGTLGILCEYLLPAHTLGEALHRASRFFDWMQKLQHRSAELQAHVPYTVSEDVATLYFIKQSSSASSVFVTQRAIASGLSSWHNFLCWLIGQPIPLLEVQFQGRCQLDESKYRRIFKAPLSYQQAHNTCRISAATLEAPVSHSQESLEEFLRLAPYYLVGQCERDSSEYSISSKVKQLLGDDFSGKSPGIDKTAKLLSIPPRALRKGLEREGISFQALKDEARLEAAIRHLRDRGQSLEEIAAHIGYEEVAAFDRAFKKWSGLSPQQYREQIGMD